MIDTVIYSLIVGIAVGFSAGYLGSIMVLEKMALVGDAMSHVALPGLALGVLLGFNPLLGGFVFLFVSAVLIWYLGRVTKLSFETLVGAAFTLALAIGILLYGANLDALESALFGDITNVNLTLAVVSVAVSAVIVFLTHYMYKKIVLSLISDELAKSKGINTALVNLLYLLLVSVTVAIGIQVTGTLLVGFLVVTPAADARTISGNLSRYLPLSAVFGAVSAVSGILLSVTLPILTGVKILPGPMIVISGVIIFVIALIYRRVKKLTV
jgi:ABC-type Mn2+/Zn2+ transport system permease subunit